MYIIGKVTAVVGPSGSGKSTIASLILRMYDVSSGNITIDGTPVTEFNPQWLRQNIGLVAQVRIFENVMSLNKACKAVNFRVVFFCFVC